MKIIKGKNDTFNVTYKTFIRFNGWKIFGLVLVENVDVQF